MADSVALYSPSPKLRAVTAAFFSLEGLRVIARVRLPEAPPHARMIFVDIALAASPESLRRFVIDARLIGSEVTLIGHWSRADALMQAAADLRLTAIPYPVHPRRFLEEVVVNPFYLRPDPDVNRGRLVKLAGLLYEREGIVAEPEALAAAVAARMTELLVASFPVYLQIIAEGLEIAALAGLLMPEAPSLFQPSALFRRLDAILNERSSKARILIWRPGPADLGLSAALLAGPRAEVTVLDDPTPDLRPSLVQLLLRGVPADFRSIVGAAMLRPDPGRADPGAIAALEQLEGPFDIVVFPLAGNAARGASWIDELHRALSLLVPGEGRLLLLPRERLMIEGLPIEPTGDGVVSEYRRVGERSRA